jgi:hypothetical protein
LLPAGFFSLARDAEVLFEDGEEVLIAPVVAGGSGALACGVGRVAGGRLETVLGEVDSSSLVLQVEPQKLMAAIQRLDEAVAAVNEAAAAVIGTADHSEEFSVAEQAIIQEAIEEFAQLPELEQHRRVRAVAEARAAAQEQVLEEMRARGA